jgi:hypothetical protein
MSLAMYAAPFDEENTQVNNKDNDNTIARKRISHNRTQKRIPKENNYSEKVHSVLKSIHNLPDNSDNSNELADFNPLPPPTSVGVEQTIIRDNETANNVQDNNDSNISSNREYYKRFMPNYEQMYKNSPVNMPYYTGNMETVQRQIDYNNNNNSTGENNLLLDKLNYMIHLLEEQQDEKTGNVTEEIILYCFLGIFIIFVIDSFVRVGKYVR